MRSVVTRSTDWQPTADDLRLLAGLARGQTVAVVARRTGVSPRTVRRRLRQIADELGVDTTIEVVVHAARRGWV